MFGCLEIGDSVLRSGDLFIVVTSFWPIALDYNLTTVVIVRSVHPLLVSPQLRLEWRTTNQAKCGIVLGSLWFRIIFGVDGRLRRSGAGSVRFTGDMNSRYTPLRMCSRLKASSTLKMQLTIVFDENYSGFRKANLRWQRVIYLGAQQKRTAETLEFLRALLYNLPKSWFFLQGLHQFNIWVIFLLARKPMLSELSRSIVLSFSCSSFLLPIDLVVSFSVVQFLLLMVKRSSCTVSPNESWRLMCKWNEQLDASHHRNCTLKNLQGSLFQNTHGTLVDIYFQTYMTLTSCWQNDYYPTLLKPFICD